MTVAYPPLHLPMPGTPITVREVGLRDGLQSIARVVPTSIKCAWIDASYAAGIREIEVGSFVPADRLPQLADTAEVLAHACTLPGLTASVLVPNLRGARDALEHGAPLMLVPLSASRAHSLANLRKSIEDAVADVARMRAERDSSGATTRIEGGVSTAFGCTLQGPVPAKDVLDLVQALLDAGADQISLADTVGFADPGMVARLFEQAKRVAGDRLTGGHFHDTRGLALANTLAALGQGVQSFDSSLAGIGGCPHAPGASGNAATEDLAYLLSAMGYDTGIDLPALLAVRAHAADWLSGETLRGSLGLAGLPRVLSAVTSH